MQGRESGRRLEEMEERREREMRGRDERIFKIGFYLKYFCESRDSGLGLGFFNLF